MESLTYSWFSEPEVVNQSCDILNSAGSNHTFMDGFLETVDDILGEDFLKTFEFDPFCNLNDDVPSVGSTTTFCTDPQSIPHHGSPEPPSSGSGSPPKRKRISVHSTPVILNFGDKIIPKNVENVNSSWPLDPDQQTANKSNRDRPQSQTYDHIISERKRRKLLSEQFLTLSGMVPGLKKMDKTSVLGATIKYMGSLQKRAEMLEEKLAKETVESAVLVRKSQIMVEQEDDEGSSSDENSGCSSFKQPLPEIETKVCNNQALLKIHCEKQKGVMVKILAVVEKLNLSVVHSNVSPFGNFILDITIMVEMDKECSLTANQIVQALHSALRTTA